MGSAQDRFETERRARIAYTLAIYLREGGPVTWEPRYPADGSGVREREVGWSVRVESVRFWATWSRLERERGWD